jgi:PGF-CTERM protein
MLEKKWLLAFFVASLLIFPANALAQECIECHSTVTPGIVKQWLSGNMSKQYGCEICHGSAHSTADDWEEATSPSPETCKACHSKQYNQYADGKHYYAWIAMEAMPALQHIPSPQKSLEGFKGCSGCHRIGVIADEEKEGKYGASACDSCHTRHKFSKSEAEKPEACLPCHQGFDHPQYEMWSTSKHGVIYRTEGDTGRAPKCQTCHMPDGTHGVMTAWGFLALRVPEDDQKWWEDRVTILQALGVLDEKGEPTERFDVVKAGKVARLSEEEWQDERDKMIKRCSECHSENFVKEQLEAADQMIKEADAILADEIRTVKRLYDEGILEKPEEWDFAPDLLQFYAVNTSVEQELYLSFMEYRMRAFQGAFHINPDYSHWYGWAPLNSARAKINYEAGLMMAAHEEKTQQAEVGLQEEKSTPGFEVILAVCGIVAAVYLFRRK